MWFLEKKYLAFSAVPPLTCLCPPRKNIQSMTIVIIYTKHYAILLYILEK